MTRRMEPIDLMAAIGAFATIIGGGFLFMASNGTLESVQPQLATVEQTSAEMGPMAAMEWVQPALGQAIVQNDLLDRAIIGDIQAAAKELNRVILMAQSLEGGTATSFNDLSAGLMTAEADHAAWVQYVLGRSIVVFTGRGIRSGVLSPGLIEGPYNQRMIALTETRGTRMESAYEETRQPMLGRVVVAVAQEAVKSGEELQDRLGKAVVRIGFMDRFQSIDQNVDLGDLKACDLEIEVQFQFREHLELFAKKSFIPRGIKSELIICDEEGRVL